MSTACLQVNTMATASQPISFRVPPAILQQIDARRKPFGISRGEWVRGIVIQNLAGTDANALSAQIDGLAAGLSELIQKADSQKADLARVLFLLLTELGNLPRDDARNLIVERFLQAVKEQA